MSVLSASAPAGQKRASDLTVDGYEQPVLLAPVPYFQSLRKKQKKTKPKKTYLPGREETTITQVVSSGHSSLLCT